MYYTIYCPSCDYVLMLEEYSGNYVILDNGKVVTSCPKCHIDFVVRDGELFEEE